jgi:diguanylate cyclase (GGDEF)-like protein/PAS domain S-box-containing protein
MTADRAEATLDSIGDAVLSTDIDGAVTYLNAAAELLTGWSCDAATGLRSRDVFHIVHRGTRKRARDPLREAVRLNKTVRLTPDCMLIRRDGQETEIEDSAAPIHDRDGRMTGAVVVFRDVAKAAAASREMSRLAQHDALTGLPNRVLLDDRLLEAIALAQRRTKFVAVLFLDVDGFKTINDLYGHATGDRLLQSIASRLTGALRLSDTVSRYSGDEFVIVLSEIERPADAGLVAAKLVEAAAEPYGIGERDVMVTMSAGVAIYPDHGRNGDALITSADAAMYGAKRAGRGQYRLVESPVDALAATR